jgi:hypothetical protein
LRQPSIVFFSTIFGVIRRHKNRLRGGCLKKPLALYEAIASTARKVCEIFHDFGASNIPH